MVLLEAVVSARQAGHQLPGEYVVSGLKRLLDYIDQHGSPSFIAVFMRSSATVKAYR